MLVVTTRFLCRWFLSALTGQRGTYLAQCHSFEPLWELFGLCQTFSTLLRAEVHVTTHSSAHSYTPSRCKGVDPRGVEHSECQIYKINGAVFSVPYLSPSVFLPVYLQIIADSWQFHSTSADQNGVG